MRIVIQRSLNSSVVVDGQTAGKIDKGLVLLVGVTEEDDMSDVEYCARKITNMRIFEDSQGKMNLSLREVEGSILSISQFTLYGNTKKGNRPSFTEAAQPDKAHRLYEALNAKLREHSVKVETGIFGAEMKLNITNDGPVTILIDSKNKDL